MTANKKWQTKPRHYVYGAGIILFVLGCMIKFFVLDKLPVSLTTVRELLAGASSVGTLANGASSSIQLEGGVVVPALVGEHPLVRHPLPPLPMPDHPFLMDETAAGGVHGDTYNSSTTPYPGPLGVAPKATYVATRPGNEISMCTALLITADQKLASVCVGFGKPSELVLFDPKNNFEIVAHTPTADPKKMGRMEPGLGWYTALDNLGRAIVVNPERKVRLYALENNGTQTQWVVAKEYDLGASLEPREPVMDVRPDWHNNLWFSSGEGRVGLINTTTGDIQQIKLPQGEVSGTALSVSQEAVFVLTNQALYRFEVDVSGKIVMRWRHFYGQPNSTADLTSPTIFDEGKLISFGMINDEAHPRARVLVLKTDATDMSPAARIVCEHPVFKPGKGELNNTFVGYGKAMVIQNNYGAGFFEPGWSEPGLVRVDVRPDYSGCDTVWENYEVSSKVPPKLSTADGYVYEYTRRMGTDKDMYAMYLSAIDFATGKLVSELFVGSGKRLDSPMLSINFTPDGTMVAGGKNGLVVLKDSLQAQAPAP